MEDLIEMRKAQDENIVNFADFFGNLSEDNEKKEPSKRSSSTDEKSHRTSLKSLDQRTTKIKSNDSFKKSKSKDENKKIPVEIEKRVTELLEDENKKRTTKKQINVCLNDINFFIL